ncbi:unnamed protein product [Callosobruchus maculatus]|uniref:Uncharacterized protein n=1 Tax=Callosobruchus maculatus TaxID=64391 RepID=A0A653BVY7_CALMS|nr:unnamed protein product [Callosobruchus maculatus]
MNDFIPISLFVVSFNNCSSLIHEHNLFLFVGDLRRPIFDRDDVVVNSEEQIGSVDSRLESPRSRNLSRSASRSSRSPECNRRDDRSKKKGEEKRTHPFAG